MRVRHDSRNKVGIDWYDSEAEADEQSPRAKEQGRKAQIEGYDFGYLSVGRDKGFDYEGCLGCGMRPDDPQRDKHDRLQADLAREHEFNIGRLFAVVTP